MPQSRFYEIWAVVDGLLFAPAMDEDGHPNPLLLKIAARGRWIQLNVLHIPVRFGLFSSGPPHVWVQEATIMIILVLGQIFIIPLEVSLLLLLRLYGRPIAEVFWIFMALYIVTASVFVSWPFERRTSLRSPGSYDWGREKVRTD